MICTKFNFSLEVYQLKAALKHKFIPSKQTLNPNLSLWSCELWKCTSFILFALLPLDYLLKYNLKVPIT